MGFRRLLGGLIGLPAVILTAAVAVSVACGWNFVASTWHVRAARHALASGDVRAALHALGAAPASAEVFYLLGRAHRRDGELDLAASFFEQAERAGWPDKDLEFQRYLSLVQAGQFEHAGPYLRRVLAAGADDEQAFEIYDALARGYMRAFRLQDALLCLDYFIGWRPELVSPRLQRGEIWERMFQWEIAARDYREVLARHPGETTARWHLGDCLLELQQVHEALREYERCLEDAPRCIEALHGVAKCLWKLGDVARSKTRFEELLVVDLHPDRRAEALLALAGIAAFESRESDVVDLASAVLAIDPCHSSARHLLGTIYARMGRQADAQRELDEAIRQRDLASRFAEITRELFASPGDADLRWEAGHILMEQGRTIDGAAWMATALEFDPNHSKTRAELAKYYSEIERPDLAGRFLRDSDR